MQSLQHRRGFVVFNTASSSTQHHRLANTCSHLRLTFLILIQLHLRITLPSSIFLFILNLSRSDETQTNPKELRWIFNGSGNEMLRLNVRPLLRLACSSIFLVHLQVSLIVQHIPDEEEDMTVTNLWVYQALDTMPIAEALPGNIFLIVTFSKASFPLLFLCILKGLCKGR
ncbi:unnamed protein product [Vicia faba]|uniref:Uncharacterized protein n=1 Tax=Vicia faba TaxID=3906 RepID=A0AAV1AX13_VICFA|nr:unnamed protein product [Vicia faba]